MGDFLYTIVRRARGWEVLKAEVAKRTPKTIFFKERNLASRFLSQVHIDNVSLNFFETPRAAWEAQRDLKAFEQEYFLRQSENAKEAMDYAIAQLETFVH